MNRFKHIFNKKETPRHNEDSLLINADLSKEAKAVSKTTARKSNRKKHPSLASTFRHFDTFKSKSKNQHDVAQKQDLVPDPSTLDPTYALELDVASYQRVQQSQEPQSGQDVLNETMNGTVNETSYDGVMTRARSRKLLLEQRTSVSMENDQRVLDYHTTPPRTVKAAVKKIGKTPKNSMAQTNSENDVVDKMSWQDENILAAALMELDAPAPRTPTPPSFFPDENAQQEQSSTTHDPRMQDTGTTQDRDQSREEEYYLADDDDLLENAPPNDYIARRTDVNADMYLPQPRRSEDFRSPSRVSLYSGSSSLAPVVAPMGMFAQAQLQRRNSLVKPSGRRVLGAVDPLLLPEYRDIPEEERVLEISYEIEEGEQQERGEHHEQAREHHLHDTGIQQSRQDNPFLVNDTRMSYEREDYYARQLNVAQQESSNGNHGHTVTSSSHIQISHSTTSVHFAVSHLQQNFSVQPPMPPPPPPPKSPTRMQQSRTMDMYGSADNAPTPPPKNPSHRALFGMMPKKKLLTKKKPLPLAIDTTHEHFATPLRTTELSSILEAGETPVLPLPEMTPMRNLFELFTLNSPVNHSHPNAQQDGARKSPTSPTRVVNGVEETQVLRNDLAMIDMSGRKKRRTMG